MSWFCYILLWIWKHISKNMTLENFILSFFFEQDPKQKNTFFGEIDLRENFKNRRFRKLILARFFEVLIRWINSTQKFIHVKELMISC